MLTQKEQYMLADIEWQFGRFMRGEFGRNAWLENDIIRIYVRISNRKLGNHRLREVIDVANISIDDEYRGKGICTEVFAMIERCVLPDTHIFVENVLSPTLLGILKRRGYKTSRRYSMKRWYCVYKSKKTI